MRHLAALGFVCLALPGDVWAATSVGRDARLDTFREEVSYRLDRAGATPEEVLRDGGGWISQRTSPYRAQGGPHVVWARFEIPGALAQRPLMITTSAWERAEFFTLCGPSVVDRQRAGTLVPPAERTTKVRMTPSTVFSGFAEIRAPPGCAPAVVARLSGEGRFVTVTRLSFTLWDAGRVRDSERSELLFQGFFLGIVGFLIAYNLGLFIVTREASYLHYVAMEAAFALGWMSVVGFAMEHLWPRSPGWNHYANWVALLAGYAALFAFLRSYLDMSRRLPRLGALLKRLGLGVLAFVPVMFVVDYPLLPIGAAFLSAGVAVVLAGVIYALWRHGHPLARNTNIALACLGGGVVVYLLHVANVVPASMLTSHAAQIGSALTGIVLSWGLGLRLQAMRSAHEREKLEIVERERQALERKVLERTAELADAQARADALLANILPAAVIAELKETGASEPRRHEHASILFADLAGFTEAVATIPPGRLVRELDEIFRALDDIVARLGLEKIKTIGDSYMAAAGLPRFVEDHAVRAVRAAVSVARFIESRNATSAMKWHVRVGVHSGDVVAGVVGKHKYAYDVWGDTVNVASRLEAAGEPGRVNISAYTFELVRDHFECEYRGKVHAKGKGSIDMYFVLRERAAETAGLKRSDATRTPS